MEANNGCGGDIRKAGRGMEYGMLSDGDGDARSGGIHTRQW